MKVSKSRTIDGLVITGMAKEDSITVEKVGKSKRVYFHLDSHANFNKIYQLAKEAKLTPTPIKKRQYEGQGWLTFNIGFVRVTWFE